jgi:hypothetical protein
MFRRLDVLPSTGEGGDTFLLGPHLRTEADTVSETLFFYLEFRTMDKVQKPSDSECSGDGV